jgi:hypothetical protein
VVVEIAADDADDSERQILREGGKPGNDGDET